MGAKVVIARACTEDVVFVDAEGSSIGHDALDAGAQALLEKFPTFVFAREGRLYASDGLGVLGWTFGPPDGPPPVRGVDVAFVRGGRIDALHTVFSH